jgi:cellulose synthase operon protein C
MHRTRSLVTSKVYRAQLRHRNCVLSVLLLIATALSPTIIAAADAADSASEYYEDARQRMSNEDFAGALIQIRNALKAEPGHLPSLELAGQIHLRQGDGAAAERHFKEARSHGADPSAIAISLARALFIQGKYKQLLDDISVGDVRTSEVADLLVLRGRASLSIGQPREADKEFSAAAELAPDSADPIIGRANVARYLDRDGEALALLDKAEAIDKKNPDVWFFRGGIARRKTELDVALKQYNRALELAPEHMPARIGRAATLIDLLRDEDALKDLEFVHAKIPGDAQANYLHALVLMRAGEAKKAREMMGKTDDALLSLDPEFLKDHAPTLLLFGAVAYAQKEYEQAYAHLSQFDRMQPAQPGARKLMAAILLRRNEASAAQNLLEPVVRVAPNDPEIHALLGEALMMRGLYSQAKARFETAIDLAPEHPGVLAQLGVSQIFLGDPKSAEQDLLAARQRDPSDIRIGLILGRVYMLRGAYDDTIKLARELFEVDRRNPGPFNLAGVAQLKKRNAKAARVAFNQALALDKTYIPAYLNLARVDEFEKQFDVAEQRLRKVVTDFPNNGSAQSALARFLESRQKIPEAIKEYEKLRLDAPSMLMDQLRLVELYLRTGDVARADDITRDMEANHADNVLLLVSRARTQLASGKASHAIMTLRQAGRFAGTNAAALKRIGALQRQAGDLEGARFTLEQALVSSPNYLPASAEMVRVDLAAGNGEKALERIGPLRQSYPDSAEVDVLAAEALSKLKRHAEAASAYQAAADKNPKYPKIAQMVFDAHRATGQVAVAVEWLRKWSTKHGSNPELQKLLADGYYESGKFDLALKEFQALLKQDPNNGPVLNSIARIYQYKNDPRSTELAERALKTEPKNAQFMDTLGWGLVMNDETERGLEILRQAQTRASTDPRIRYHVAATLTRLGREREAAEELREVLKRPEHFAERADAERLLKRLSAD